MYSNSSDLTGRSHAHARNSVISYGQGGGSAAALDLSAITEGQRDLSHDLASSERRGLAVANWEPLSPRDRYLHARERELRLSDSLSSLPKTARLGAGRFCKRTNIHRYCAHLKRMHAEQMQNHAHQQDPGTTKAW
jgi:hypothetical protein